jgi:outer membrane protein assembly factor BamB
MQKHPWTSMRGNERNDGYAHHDVQSSDATIRHFTTGNAIFSTPIIGSDECIYVGSADNAFYAFDAKTGHTRWSFVTEGIIDSAACMDSSGMLYVPSGDGSLYKLNQDGQEVWKLDLLSRTPRTLSTIYWWEGNATIGPNGWIYAGNDDFCLYAIDPSGTVQWTFASGLQIWSAPAFHKKLVYTASFDMHVYAMEESTGYVKWAKRLENSITASPAISQDGTLFIGCFDGILYALNSRSGSFKWKRPTNGAIYASATITPNNKVIIGSCDGFLYCIDAETGNVEWKYDAQCPIWSSCAVAKDISGTYEYVIYMGDSKGYIVALSPHGTLIWRYASGLKEGGKKNDINASIALGNFGLAAASTRGEVLYIPYDAYLHPSDGEQEYFAITTEGAIRERIIDVVQAPHAEVRSIPEANLALQIRQIVFTTPAIITPLDQIGIVSLTINLRIIRVDPITGHFVAWGVQTFGYGDDGQPVGIPEPRYYFYAFSGTTQGDTICLQSKNCDFEITAFPIPLDTLSFIAIKNGDQWEGKAVHGFLYSHQLMLTLLKRYGTLSMTYVCLQLFKRPLLRGLHFHLASGWRTVCAIWELLIQRQWKKWGLLDIEGNFTTIGTFALAEADQRRSSLQFIDASFHQKKRRITATFISHGTRRFDDGFPGILLIDTETTQAVPLQYWKYLNVRYAGKSVTVTFTIPASIDLSRVIDAVVLVNCDVQTTLTLS